MSQEINITEHLSEAGQTEETVNINNEHEEGQAVSHEITLYAEPVGQIGGFQVTNSLITSWSVVLVIVILAVLLGRGIKRIPRGLQNITEIIIDGSLDLMDSVTGDRTKSTKIFPFVFSIFLFILLSNWLGLVPGIGSIGFIESGHGQSVFVPWFRGATADLNTTLALALLAVLAANIFGIFAVGGWRFLNKFVNVKALAEIPGRVIKEPAVVFVNPIKFFVGLIEIIGEIAKVASLSFRLFGNIFAGEVLLASMAMIFAYLTPVPFIFLEIIVGIIQALIFAILTLVYFTIASTAEEH